MTIAAAAVAIGWMGRASLRYAEEVSRASTCGTVRQLAAEAASISFTGCAVVGAALIVAVLFGRWVPAARVAFVATVAAALLTCSAVHHGLLFYWAGWF